MISTQQAIDMFRKGKVAVFPTDTAFGIGCRMDNTEAVSQVFKIKKRGLDNALLVLVDSIEMAEEYVKFDPRSLTFVKKYWPGGLTIFLPCDKDRVPSIVRAGMDTLAVRMPQHEDMLTIIKEVGVPIIATSANISGEETPYTLDQVSKEILSQVDFVMPGECTFKKESTIIDCSVTPWKKIRDGAVHVDL